MNLRRRQFLHLAAGTVALPAVSCVATAQTYPTRPARHWFEHAIAAKEKGGIQASRVGESAVLGRMIDRDVFR